MTKYSKEDAERGDSKNPSEEEQANARLIAAAPELLEACRYAQDAMLRAGLSCDCVTTAIAHAESR